jgi:hypothetical protein
MACCSYFNTPFVLFYGDRVIAWHTIIIIIHSIKKKEKKGAITRSVSVV